MTFYEKVKGLCEQQGTAITKMIVELGFSKSAATTWKNSRKIPRPNTVKKVADYLGITINDLKAGIDEPIDLDNIDTSEFNQSAFRHLLEKYKGDEKQAIKAYLEFEKAQANDAVSDIDRLAIYQNNGGVVGVQGHAHAPVTINNGTERILSEQELEMLRIFSELSLIERSRVIVYAAELKEKSGGA